MQIGVIGINHKQADVRIREMLATAFQKRFFLENPLTSFVVLSTCNRCEIYFSDTDVASAHQLILTILREEISDDFEQKCYTFFGQDCFMHLAKVTAGLDSAVLHETEIQGQVKTAYESATTYRMLTTSLHFLFQKSLHIAKKVRSSHTNHIMLFDIEHAVHYLADTFFIKQMPHTLFIGTSEINSKIARFLKKKGFQKITFCNRTRVKAEKLAAELEVDVLAWDELTARVVEFDFVISAVSSPTTILKSTPANGMENKLLIDLAVPRNIAPDIGGTLYNIDDINNLINTKKTALQISLHEAEEMVERLISRQKKIHNVNVELVS